MSDCTSNPPLTASCPDLSVEEGCTDLSNARRLVLTFGGDIRYWGERKTWLVWQGTHWAPDSSGAVARMAYEIVDTIWQDAMKLGSDLARRWAANSASKSRIDAMVRLAGPMVPISAAELNRNPNLLATPTGTLDLTTGLLRDAQRDDFITQICPTHYDPDATALTWDRFVREVFSGDVELIDFVQRLMGYCLTGLTTEQKLPIFWGEGANGKSTFIEAITHVMGKDYSGPMPSELLMVQRHKEHAAELMTLFGRRLVFGQETQSGGRLNEARVKWLTGGDTLTGRGMRENFVCFKPTHKLLLCTNHKPIVAGTDHAIWRRLLLIPFTRTFQEHEQDRQLPRKLQAEASGILNWLVAGCSKWHADGLRSPEAIQVATRDYQSSQDVLGRFIDECCIVGEGHRVKAKNLQDALEAYCSENEMPKPSAEQRKTFMTGHYKRTRLGTGWHYLGVGLLTESDDQFG